MSRAMVAELVERRAQRKTELDGVLETAKTEKRAALSEDEQKRFDALETEILEIDKRCAELDEQIKRDEAAADIAKRYAGPAVVKSEPEEYRQGGQRSFFRDVYKARQYGDRDALERLTRNDKMVAEKRAITTVNGAGGEFVPPLWLEDQFIKFARAGRVTVDQVTHQPLPAGTDSINIPKINTGTAVATQATQNTAIQQTDLTTTSVNSAVLTIAGGQTVSLQLIEQSPLNIDEVVLQDLAADYAMKLDVQGINGSGAGGNATGILTLGGTNAVTFTSASPTLGLLYSKIADAIQRVHTLRFMPPDRIIMHPRRWAWALAALDSQNRPLIVPAAGGPFNVAGNQEGVHEQGYVGSIQGLPVFTDANIPTNLGAGTNQDPVLVLRASDVILWESQVRAEAFQQTYANQLSVFIRLYNYYSFQAGRYAPSISVINGTGMVAPTF